jgi:cytochrome d ubiquinol oxidase subunit I
MDPAVLARIQFGMTVAFHFLFPAVTIGMGWIISFMAWRHLRTGEELYDKMTQFWLRVFAIFFAVGVATGITMEFQFGTNWATYARFVGDIFGSPLAAEGIFAFFLESVFMGVLLFGKNRVSRRFYWFASLMVALGSTLSGFWIVAANSWMQTPAAYQIVGEGAMRRAELTNFWQAVFNPSTVIRYLHTIAASLVVGGFFVAGTSAWYLLKGRHQEFARRSLMIGLVVAAIFTVGVGLMGHLHSIEVWENQPLKLATYEGWFVSHDHAGLVLFGYPDAERGELRYAIVVPNLGSLLLGWNVNTPVQGMEEWPRDEWPPIIATFYSYHLMFQLGLLMIGISWLGIILREKRFTSRLYLRLLLYTIPIPWIVVELGWMAAELGRQPWAVYGLLRTADAVSVVVPAGQILFTIILFALIYAALGVLTISLVVRRFRQGPEPVTKEA